MGQHITGGVTLLVAAAVLVGAVQRPVKPLSKADLVGVWAGFGSEYPYFYRLHLRADNAGSLVVLFPEATPDVYGVDWAVTNGVVLAKMTPVSSGAEPIACSISEADRRRLRFIVKGTSGQFTRTALLVNQERFEQALAESSKYDPYAGQPKQRKGAGL